MDIDQQELRMFGFYSVLILCFAVEDPGRLADRLAPEAPADHIRAGPKTDASPVVPPALIR